jgi:hypothetical protein
MTDQDSVRPRKPKLLDADRAQRAKDMARQVDAGENLAAFDRAFSKAAASPVPAANSGSAARVAESRKAIDESRELILKTPEPGHDRIAPSKK